jgi:hypothetical protein
LYYCTFFDISSSEENLSTTSTAENTTLQGRFVGPKSPTLPEERDRMRNDSGQAKARVMLENASTYNQVCRKVSMEMIVGG